MCYFHDGIPSPYNSFALSLPPFPFPFVPQQLTPSANVDTNMLTFAVVAVTALIQTNTPIGISIDGCALNGLTRFGVMWWLSRKLIHGICMLSSNTSGGEILNVGGVCPCELISYWNVMIWNRNCMALCVVLSGMLMMMKCMFMQSQLLSKTFKVWFPYILWSDKYMNQVCRPL